MHYNSVLIHALIIAAELTLLESIRPLLSELCTMSLSCFDLNGTFPFTVASDLNYLFPLPVHHPLNYPVQLLHPSSSSPQSAPRLYPGELDYFISGHYYPNLPCNYIYTPNLDLRVISIYSELELPHLVCFLCISKYMESSSAFTKYSESERTVHNLLYSA